MYMYSTKIPKKTQNTFLQNRICGKKYPTYYLVKKHVHLFTDNNICTLELLLTIEISNDIYSYQCMQNLYLCETERSRDIF